MAASPIVPRNLADPGAIDPTERKAIKDFTRRMKLIEGIYLDLIGRLEFETFETNRQCYTYELVINEDELPAPGAPLEWRRTPVVNATRYEFRTLPQTLEQLLDAAGRLVDEILAGSSARTSWFGLEYVLPAAEKGTVQSWRNLGVQSTEYRKLRPTIESLLSSEPYQKRIQLLQFREFELMKGLAGTVKRELAEVLTGGLVQGIGPREIAKNIEAQTGVEIRRAERIARTEVGQAQRTARLDEATDAATRLGVLLKMMHLSALSPTTRLTHAERHGKLYPVQEERDWFGEGANSINCKCSMTEVLVDADGSPLSTALLSRTEAARDRWLERED